MTRRKTITNKLIDNDTFSQECYWLRNYDTKNKVVRTISGEMIASPPDDGYDNAFFFYLKDTSMTFEWLCYNMRVNPSVLLDKLTTCGYYPNYEGILNNGDTSDNTTFYKKIDNYFNNKK